MLETDAQLYEAEATLLVLLLGGVGLAWLVRFLGRREGGLDLAAVAAAAFGVRVLVGFSFPLLGSAGDELRTDDDELFLNHATRLSELPLSDGFWGDAIWGDLHVALFAAQMKLLAGVGGTPLRVTQAAIAAAAIVLAAAAVNRLAGRRAALITGWFLVLEPSGVLFTTILQKEALVLLGEGVLVLGLATSWARRDLSGLPLVGAGALLVLLTRAYAGAFLLAGAVLVYAYLLWSGLGPERRRHTAVAVALVGSLIVAMAGAAVAANALDRIQGLQEHPLDANTNLQLEPVDFTTVGGLATGLPTRVFDFMFRPFPWQAENASQALGVIGTVITWTLYALLAVGLWRTRREGWNRVAPLMLIAAAIVLCYALSTVNAGTGFRHRLHLLVPLAACVASLGVMTRSGMVRALRSGAATAAVLVAGLLATGCSDSPEVTRSEVQDPTIFAELRGPDTPRRAVTRFLRRVKARSLSQALAQYEPRVRRSIGLLGFAGILDFGRNLLATVEPVVVDARADGRTARVVVRAKGYPGRRKHFDFELSWREGRWRIVRDDITEIAVRRQAQLGEQQKIDPTQEVGGLARRRAQRLVRTYRAAGSTGTRR